MEIQEILSKTILVKSNIKGIDYVINCYTGCQFACSYCYASFMGRFVNQPIKNWGNYVYVKTNAAELLKKEIHKLKDTDAVFLSSVTDPFQAVEAKYKLSQKCLEILSEFKGNVSILTKSPLVLNSIKEIKKIKNIDVGLTITSTDDIVSRYFEKNAPDVTSRLEALKKLNAAGIKTYAFIGPLLPHFVADREKLRSLIEAIYKTGTKRLFIEHINLSPYIRERMLSELKTENKVSSSENDINKFLEKFYSSQSKQYREELNKIIKEILKDYDFELLGGDVLWHHDSFLDKK